MRRLFGGYAYGDGPRAGCWWDDTHLDVSRPPLANTLRTDVAIIGGGFTGVSAALHLARSGVSGTVLDAQRIGWGASGRNGGFCCLGGSMASDAVLDQKFGSAERVAFRRTERASIELVAALIAEYGIDVDRHSTGETSLAHRPKDMAALRAHAESIPDNYGVPYHLHSSDDLSGLGMSGPFHGGLTIEAGFGLNPRKYLYGVAQAAEASGARIFERSAVTEMTSGVDGWALRVNGHTLYADRVVLATNGYSSDDLPEWLAGRYLPSQSNVIVTRPLSDEELSAAGWTTDQMVYDTRNLLHYFRLMPDRRFLFGMRGGIFTGTRAEARATARVRADFDAMFPAWREVETTHGWSGLVCLARDRLPFAGAVPGQPGLWAGLCYHGNGVAMGTYSGAVLAQLVQGQVPQMPYPEALRTPLRRFELGRLRRAMIPLAYAGYAMADR